jgi:hypothetical protein
MNFRFNNWQWKVMLLLHKDHTRYAYVLLLIPYCADWLATGDSAVYSLYVELFMAFLIMTMWS